MTDALLLVAGLNIGFVAGYWVCLRRMTQRLREAGLEVSAVMVKGNAVGQGRGRRERGLSARPSTPPEHEKRERNELDTFPGGWEAALVTPAAAMIASEIAEMLDRASAKNYIQFDFMPRMDRGMRTVRVTVQWADGESPAQKVARLEKKIEALEDELARRAG